MAGLREGEQVGQVKASIAVRKAGIGSGVVV
jgi:hypothetical protein